MLKNHIKIAWRNMLKQKSFSLINIIGLSIGVSVCFLLSLWVNDELSYDRFHENADRLYRLEWEAKYGDNSWKTPQVPLPLAGMMVREFPEVEAATQLYKGRFTVQKKEEYIRENKVLYVDENFFDLFTVKIIAGEGARAISNPNAILLTPQTAERYFGKNKTPESLLGKTIKRNDGTALQIAGIVESFPSQSHLDFDFLASLKSIKMFQNREDAWWSASVLSYFLLKENGNTEVLHQKVENYIAENLTEESDVEKGNYNHFPFEVITDIHVKPNLTYIWIFGIIAFFILILACINFINLATARAVSRAKEVGVRKVLGSTRLQLIKQFFSESTLYVLIAVAIAIFIAELALPSFNLLTDKTLAIAWLSSPFVWVALLGLIVLTSVITGAVPALVLSSFTPAKVIKGELTKTGGKDRFRQGMVVFQFCITCVLIISALIVNKQLNFLQNKNMGFNKEQVLILRSANALGNNYHPFINKLKTNPALAEVSISQYLPGDGFDSTIFLPEQPSTYKETSLTYSHVDEAFVETLGLEIVAGRNFDLSYSTDSTAYLLNEKAAEKLGWSEPVGKKLTYGGYQKGTVVGVVKNYNFSSLHDDIEPLVLCMAPTARLQNIFIRLAPGHFQQQIQTVQSTWKSMAPDAPFEYAFLDEKIDALYKSEQRMSKTFFVFVLLTIFLGCLGLFGLAAFMAEQRTKEIGIRKVLGASVAGLVGLLSKDFLKLVLLAFFLAVPLAYFFMENWLEDFAYRINIHWSTFVITALIVLSVAFLTVSFQSIKAALLNPVKSLRSE